SQVPLRGARDVAHWLRMGCFGYVVPRVPIGDGGYSRVFYDDVDRSERWFGPAAVGARWPSQCPFLGFFAPTFFSFRGRPGIFGGREHCPFSEDIVVLYRFRGSADYCAVLY